MLDLLGTIAGNILSLPGFLGLALGMATRNPIIGCVLGALVGVGETMIFAGMQFANVEMVELVVAILVGAVAGCVGSLIRIRGATV